MSPSPLVYTGPWVALVAENGEAVVLENGDTIELVHSPTHGEATFYGQPLLTVRVIPTSRWRRFLRRLALRTL